MKKRLTKFTSILVIAVLCLAFSGCSLFISNKGDAGKLPNSGSISQSITFATTEESDRKLYTDDADVAQAVNRSVVAITLKYANSTGAQSSVAGSGVIVEIDGEEYIVTCHHVIASGGEITVYVPDERSRNYGDSDYNQDYALTGVIEANRKGNINNEVILIGGDQTADIAVLKINAGEKNLILDSSPVPAEGYSIRYGEKVFAIGNPSGEKPMTFMSGNISYLDREVVINDVGEMTLVQHDVMINHGSSGGGLFNMYGELIGITNAGSDEYRGINYAIPFYGEEGYIEIAKQLIATYNSVENNFGYVSGRWAIGITVETVKEAVQGSYVRISAVSKGSNADGGKDGENQKLTVGCFIVGVIYEENGKEEFIEISNQSDFKQAVFKLKKICVASKTEPDSFKIRVYSHKLGIQDVVVTLSEQFIFCDTKIYPEN